MTGFQPANKYTQSSYETPHLNTTTTIAGWVGPEPGCQPKGASWYPAEYPKPDRALPKIKKSSKGSNIAMYSLSSRAFTGPLTNQQSKRVFLHQPVTPVSSMPLPSTQSSRWSDNQESPESNVNNEVALLTHSPTRVRNTEKGDFSRNSWRSHTLVLKPLIASKSELKVVNSRDPPSRPGRPPNEGPIVRRIVPILPLTSLSESAPSPIEASPTPTPPPSQPIKLKRKYTKSSKYADRWKSNSDTNKSTPENNPKQRQLFIKLKTNYSENKAADTKNNHSSGFTPLNVHNDDDNGKTDSTQSQHALGNQGNSQSDVESKNKNDTPGDNKPLPKLTSKLRLVTSKSHTSLPPSEPSPTSKDPYSGSKRKPGRPRRNDSQNNDAQNNDAQNDESQPETPTPTPTPTPISTPIPIPSTRSSRSKRHYKRRRGRPSKKQKTEYALELLLNLFFFIY